MKILQQLSKNSALERRFKDAGHFFWLLAVENLKLVKDAKNPSEDDVLYLSKFDEYNLLAELYVAFELVADYIEQPFRLPTQNQEIKLIVFNTCKFIIGVLEKKPSPLGISKVYIYFCLAQIGGSIEAFKTAREALEKLKNHRVPSEWNDKIDIENLRMRAKPF